MATRPTNRARPLPYGAYVDITYTVRVSADEAQYRCDQQEYGPDGRQWARTTHRWEPTTDLPVAQEASEVLCGWVDEVLARFSEAGTSR